MANYEIVVGNIGTVFESTVERVAREEYAAWVILSQNAYGRASGEDVTLFCDGEIIAEHCYATCED